jgi:chorismate mutase/prephenate dehydratase
MVPPGSSQAMNAQPPLDTSPPAPAATEPDAASLARPAAPGDAAPQVLAGLRAEIDAIDDALHDLLMRRAEVVARLAGSGIKAGAPFRPGREAAILRRLFARHRGPLPRAAILRFWRDMIGSSLAQQGGFAIATFGAAEALARQHFGLLLPLRLHPTPARALAAVNDGEAGAAVLPWPEEG